MRTPVLLLADGRSKDHHIDSPYLEKFQGVPLIVRTIRQFTGRGHPVIVVTRRADVKEVTRSQRGISFWEPTLDYSEYGGVAMIPKALDRAWARQTLVVFGDVYFTDKAVEIISEPTKDWYVYGRSTNNVWTGTQWAEWFAFSTHWGVRRQMRMAAKLVIQAYKEGTHHRATPWEWYYEMEGMPWLIRNPMHVETGPHWVEINDLTDDIDYKEDADNLRRVINER